MTAPQNIAELLGDLVPQMLPMHWLALAVPGVYLLGFLVQGFLGQRLGKAGDGVAVGLSGTAAALAIVALVLKWLQMEAAEESFLGAAQQLSPQWEWFSTGNFQVQLGIYYNEISASMLALVAFITFLVHLYSAEYMRYDARRPRYWAFLGLFAFSMAGVVLASTLFVTFIFWELVGFSSYLLIGFWYEKQVAAKASQKAFLINRIGDVGFVIALMVLAMYPESFNEIFHTSGSNLPRRYYSFAEAGGDLPSFDDALGWPRYVFSIGLLTGVLSKSAQFPLQVWLPDAMAGPTPVSSLLHAATMVAAGVFLLVRTLPLFPYEVLLAIAGIGALTAFTAALSALRQTDIKAVLAYSTISQLGFMLIGIGVGRGDFAYFHLVTHAFFKCGLFLTAGAVIHQIHAAQHSSKAHFDAQDLRLMGGLGKKMRFTLVVYLVFSAALAGLPLTAGFLSKDGILLGAFSMFYLPPLAWVIPVLGVAASLLTAFYIARQGWLIFGGTTRMEAGSYEKMRGVNWKMALPLAVLALFSLWMIYSPTHPFHFEPPLYELNLAGGHLELPWLPWALTGLAATGIGAALLLGRRGIFLRERERGFGGWLKRHYGLDGLYENIIARGVLRLAAGLAWVDRRIVDGLVNGIARLVVRKDGKWSLSRAGDAVDRRVIDAAVNGVAGGVMALGQRFRRVQTGNLQRYLVLTLLGVLALLAALIYFGGWAE